MNFMLDLNDKKGMLKFCEYSFWLLSTAHILCAYLYIHLCNIGSCTVGNDFLPWFYCRRCCQAGYFLSHRIS